MPLNDHSKTLHSGTTPYPERALQEGSAAPFCCGTIYKAENEAKRGQGHDFQVHDAALIFREAKHLLQWTPVTSIGSMRLVQPRATAEGTRLRQGGKSHGALFFFFITEASM